MKYYDSKGREIVDVDFVPGGKSDTYIDRASYADDGTDVPEDELDYIVSNNCLCYSCREFG